MGADYADDRGRARRPGAANGPMADEPEAVGHRYHALPMPHLAARWLVAPFLAHLALAQSPAAGSEPARDTADLRGTIANAAPGRVRVTVWHDDMAKHAVTPLAEGFAADDGRFTFQSVPWFRAQDWGSHAIVVVARQPGRVAVRTLRGDDAPIDAIELSLQPTIELRGTLRCADTGKPLANAWIWPSIFATADQPYAMWLTSPLLPWHATTDAEGRFVLRDLPPMASMKLLAGGREHARMWVDVADLQQPIDAALPRGGRLVGSVKRPDGSPAVRVPVMACGDGIGYGHAHTDEHGRFELSSLAPDVYKVFASDDDLTVIAVTHLRVGAGDEVDAATVQLVVGGFITGRLVDAATGKPFVPGPSTDVAMYGPARGDGGACECTPVRPDGTFRIRAPAGQNRIYLRAAGGYSEPSEVVTVVDGKETQVEWKLQPPPPQRARPAGGRPGR